MCGILGVISNKTLAFEKGLEEMAHRGPDFSATHTFKNLTVGHNRLSIIDLDVESNQPFHIGDHTIVFNGEIYNYLKIKDKLLAEGHTFRTKGDTEVLLTWLIAKGIEGISEVDGMFAFAWLNKKSSELIVCRDSLGIKPLYIYQKENDLVFSSEIKSIFSLYPEAKRIDNNLIAEYLINGFIYEPETGFENIRKLEPGSYEKYDLNAQILEKNVYWSLISIDKKVVNANDVEEAIKSAITDHLVADVPVGLFFSGGIDSSILLTQTKSKILPVTVKSSKEEYEKAGMTNDYHYALKIGELLDVHIESIELLNEKSNSNDFLNMIEEVAIGNEELIADFTFQSSKLLSQKVREKDFIVMLSGMGADEIFAGYPRYRLVKYESLFKIAKPLIRLLKKSKSFSKKVDRFENYYNEKSFGMRYGSLLGFYSREEVKTLLKKEEGIQRFEKKIERILEPAKNYSNLRKAMYLDFYGFLSHNFLVSDKSSMQASIELRVPLATKKLYELSWRLKDSDLVNFFKLKKPLRSFLLKYIPKEIVDRKKAGFNPPLDVQIKSLGKDKILQTLEENGLFSVLDRNMVEDILQEHFNNEKNNTYKIYQLLHLSFWLKNYA